jgi:formylglycine-generating enzyme required for sulfatase activity
MKPEDVAWMLYGLEPGVGDAASLREMAEYFYGNGDKELAATAADLAFALTPDNEALADFRADILESLAVREHGLHFRYVPGRCYRIGSAHGDSDEQPVHTVKLNPFWLSDTPISWSLFCKLLGWPMPQDGFPPKDALRQASLELFEGWAIMWDDSVSRLYEQSKIRLQYCGNTMKPAGDWHYAGGAQSRYNRKPMVAAAWQEVDYLAARMASSGKASVSYRLPTEAEWEAAARGGLLSSRYPWGSEPPTPKRCDFNRFSEFSIQPSRSHPPNGYGLYAMAGGVWEWTYDWYDARYYAESPRDNPTGPAHGKERVLRGGSWADCADAVTVSFRMSGQSQPFWGKTMLDDSVPDTYWPYSPNIGIRLCRQAI